MEIETKPPKNLIVITINHSWRLAMVFDKPIMSWKLKIQHLMRSSLFHNHKYNDFKIPLSKKKKKTQW